MKNTRFDLEQQIMDCWGVTDDLDMVFRAVCDQELCQDQDKLANILLGMKELYQLKFEQMWNTFEELCHKRELD